jgi:hypothetical protein
MLPFERLKTRRGLTDDTSCVFSSTQFSLKPEIEVPFVMINLERTEVAQPQVGDFLRVKLMLC